MASSLYGSSRGCPFHPVPIESCRGMGADAVHEGVGVPRMIHQEEGDGHPAPC